jgi:hypothetical protein
MTSGAVVDEAAIAAIVPAATTRRIIREVRFSSCFLYGFAAINTSNG